ncbi:hypothetical protein EII31_00025 [Leucobacter sp. OH2974_COT-288]|nr:hypothetical protein EII31_00025 [Leucobacter sp. OH2974_COT-288]
MCTLCTHQLRKSSRRCAGTRCVLNGCWWRQSAPGQNWRSVLAISEILILWGGGGLLAAAAFLALLRALLGPTVLDRMIASDVLLTTIVLVLGLEMVINKHTNSVPVMIGVSATAALATITVARYVRRKADGQNDKLQQMANNIAGMIDMQGARTESADKPAAADGSGDANFAGGLGSAASGAAGAVDAAGRKEQV